MDNILKLPHPELAYCRVEGYRKSHSFMEIKVNYKDDLERDTAVFLQLPGVEYFEGPMIWQGANFRLASSADCLKLLHQLGRYEGVEDEYLSEKFQLITTLAVTPTQSNLEIKILTAANNISTTAHFYPE
jgi:hypothetical protein